MHVIQPKSLKGLNHLKNLLILLLFFSYTATADETSLPDIGDQGASQISLDEERRLGEAWLRVLRGRASQLRDPFVQEYTQNLLYELVQYSPLADKNLTLVLLDNPTLNAFAVPGSIIGIHSGLYYHAKTEAQFASVLAHELAHLSQRHYSSNVEEQRKSLPLQLATLFGAILVASTTNNSDATVATLASGQAAIADKQLAYSRQNEREADDLGMTLMAKAGFDPKAMPGMFEQMMRASRFNGDQIPEFLRTHPVTQSRIADSQNRASQYPVEGKNNSLDYQLIRSRVVVSMQKNPELLLQQYQGMKTPKVVDHFIHVLAGISADKAEGSQYSMEWLLDNYPNNLQVKALQVEYLNSTGDDSGALTAIDSLLSIYPQNQPLQQLKINIYNQQKNYEAISVLLKQMLTTQPKNDFLWFQLAENEGLIGNLFGVHKSRAEFYLLRGNTKKAETHLKQALRIPTLTEQDKAVLKEQLKETKAIRDSLNF